MKKILIVTLIMFVTLPAFCGGWLQGKDKGFFKLSQSIIRGDGFFNGDGDQVDIITVGVYQTSLYGEYGISEKMDVIAYLPFVSRLTVNDALFSNGTFLKGDEFTSIGDAQLGVKYGLRQGKKLVISASLILGLPLGNPEGGESGVLQTGDGEFNQLLMVDFGYGFNVPVYANVGIGLNNRTKDFSEEFRATAELGYKLNEKWIFAAKFSTVQSFMNGDAKGSTGSGIFSNDLEYIAFGPEISYLFSDKWGFTATYQTASAGRFILAEPAYSFGLFLKLD